MNKTFEHKTIEGLSVIILTIMDPKFSVMMSHSRLPEGTPEERTQKVKSFIEAGLAIFNGSYEELLYVLGVSVQEVVITLRANRIKEMNLSEEEMRDLTKYFLKRSGL